MTAIIRHPPSSMSSIASHVYPDLSQHPHLRPPISQLSNHSSGQFLQQSEQVPLTKYENDTGKMIVNGATQQSRMNGGPHQQANQQPYTQHHSIQPLQPIQNVSRQNYSTGIKRARSPIEDVSPKNVEFKQEPDMYQADSTDQIAPYLQIPLEINSSKGSLSDFAAQITCLFWFESSQTLLRVEEARSVPSPSQPLIPEANPTIGFRKWVTTILSTTQVSTNVVLLALMFIYRLKKMNPQVKGRPGSEYRLLTVALMLGNKFLDDNTYTNKTWGEVSGITVNEIHVMEVEFLSNMRYTLYASKEEWKLWLQKLGRFAEYFDAASKAIERSRIAAMQQPPISTAQSMPIQVPLQPTTPTNIYAPLHRPITTPPGRQPHPLAMPLYPVQTQPLSTARIPEPEKFNSRKRSYDDSSDERPTKRISRNPASIPTSIPHTSDMISQTLSIAPANTIYADHVHPRAAAVQTDPALQRPVAYLDPAARLPPPIMPGQQMVQQLPMTYPQMHMSRAMASVYNPLGQSGLELSKPLSQPQMHPQLGLRIPPLMDANQPVSNAASRNNSPLAGGITPTGDLLSPMVYGHYRSSPYKPVRTVNSLLAPPPSASLGNPADAIESSDLQYRPLGKQPGQSRVGVVPHIPQAYHQYPWPIQQVNQRY